MKTILAPVDFSDITDQVVAEAKTLALTFGGRVVLVHAVRPPIIINEYAPEAERLAEDEQQSAETALGRWHRELQSSGVEAEAVVRHDYPVAAILEEAHQARADYIVMGSHGRTALHDLLVGDTAHGVLRKAPCPVLIVPAPRYVRGSAPSSGAAASG
jgi:nucleotide-binding universal stress UspA family protein